MRWKQRLEGISEQHLLPASLGANWLPTRGCLCGEGSPGHLGCLGGHFSRLTGPEGSGRIQRGPHSSAHSMWEALCCSGFSSSSMTRHSQHLRLLSGKIFCMSSFAHFYLIHPLHVRCWIFFMLLNYFLFTIIYIFHYYSMEMCLMFVYQLL